MNGYPRDYAEGMGKVQAFLKANNFTGVCYSFPLKAEPDNFSSMKERNGSPSNLMSWMDGRPADKVIEGKPKEFQQAVFANVVRRCL